MSSLKLFNGKPAEAVTLQEFFDGFYQPRRLADCNPKTVLQYGVQFRHFERFLGREPTLADLTDDCVSGLLLWLTTSPRLRVSGKKRSPATVNKARNHLIALWELAWRKGFLDEGPDVRAMREYKRVPDAWSTAEMQRLVTHCEKLGGNIAGTKIPASGWWKAIILVCYDCGQRIGATLSLRQADVDFANRYALFRAEHQKHRADERKPLHADTLDALREIWEPERELVFPWNSAPTYIWGTLTTILKDAGLDHGRRSKFHRIRRTSYTNVFNALGSKAATLHAGHSQDLSKHYLDTTKLEVTNVVDVLPRPKAGLDAAEDVIAEIHLGEAEQQIDALVEVYAAYLVDRGISSGHIVNTCRMIRELCQQCGFSTVADLDASKVWNWSDDKEAAGAAYNTMKRWRSAMSVFGRWLVKDRGIIAALAFANEMDPHREGGRLRQRQTMAEGGAV